MAAEDPHGDAGDPVRVAIVDDDRRYGDALAELIELSERFTVVGVADGVESGRALLGQRDVQMGLVDVNMAEGGGPAIVRACRTWSYRPALVLISAQSAPPDLVDLGVAFVAKDQLDVQLLWTLWKCRAQ